MHLCLPSESEDSMSLAEWREMHDLIRRLIALEAPAASKAEREQMAHDWIAAGYEEVVSAWTYSHRKIREQEQAVA